jgi:hypothetical protein
VAELHPSFVRTLFNMAMQECRDAGAPFEMSEDAFLLWSNKRPVVAKTA